MWIETKFLEKDTDIFSVYGKTIFLAQKFEGICKKMVLMFKLLCDVEEEKFQLLDDDYLESSERLSRLMLGKIIRQAISDKTKMRINDEEIDILIAAKDSRNWVAHEMTVETIKNNVSAYQGSTELKDEYLMHLKNLIKGEFLVSEWGYYLHKEYEFRPSKNINDYMKEILEWISI